MPKFDLAQRVGSLRLPSDNIADILIAFETVVEMVAVALAVALAVENMLAGGI